MLEGTAITKRFGGLTALTGVDFRVGRDEIVGLIGPNGSGKTTLFNVISGLFRPDGGEIRFKGRRINGLAPYRVAAMGIGRTFQIVRPLMDLNLVENVTISVLYGASGIRTMAEARDRAEHILEFTGLADKAASLPTELVLEDRKRLEVARVLGAEPEIVLLDEVFAGLNPKEVQGAVELVFRIREDFGVAIFMIEHVMKAIMETCSRVMVLHNGMKIADDEPSEVANHPEVVRAYLGPRYAGD